MKSYVVCTVKPWNVDAFHRHRPRFPGTWHLVEAPDALTPELLGRLTPRYVFFPHWSWRVPPEIICAHECVCFHMTDVPFGRGGSPLQNLILNGKKDTVLTALRMVDEMDAGPVYFKAPLSLAGSAEEIYRRASETAYEMIERIVADEPVPVPQSGEPTFFTRRKPVQSALPKSGSPEAIYDFIRMLDAPTYPKAFIDWGDIRIEFDRAEAATDGSVEARATIRTRSES